MTVGGIHEGVNKLERVWNSEFFQLFTPYDRASGKEEGVP